LNDKYSANYATQVAATMGFGDFSPTDLKKSIGGKNSNHGCQFSPLQKDGFSGNSSVKDVETMLQLLYLRVTAPRKTAASLHCCTKSKSFTELLPLKPSL